MWFGTKPCERGFLIYRSASAVLRTSCRIFFLLIIFIIYSIGGDHVLADDGNAVFLGRFDVCNGRLPAVDEDLALFRVLDAARRLNQGGLAGAVFPQQGVDFPAFS